METRRQNAKSKRAEEEDDSDDVQDKEEDNDMSDDVEENADMDVSYAEMKKKRKQHLKTKTKVAKKLKHSGLKEDAVVDAAEQAELESYVRMATHDFSPHNPPLTQFMYWKTKSPDQCLNMLLKRHAKELVHLTDKYEPAHLAFKYAADVRKCANNERSVQVKQIKLTWLSKTNSDWQLAENLLEAELDFDSNAPPRVHNNLKCSFKTVDELRDVIRSGDMYTYPKLFHLFCSGVERGTFRKVSQRRPQSIAKYMTIAHEANFRLELWFALGKKSFRHQTYPSWLKIRAKNFVDFLQFVKADRKDHLATAVAKRAENNETEAAEGDEDDDDDDSVDGVEIDPALLA